MASLMGSVERFISVGAPDAWALLLGEVLRAAKDEAGPGLLMLMDRITAQRPDADALRAVADRAIIFGEKSVAVPDNVVQVPQMPDGMADEQFLVLVSPRLAVALTTQLSRGTSPGAPYGAWTLSRQDAIAFGERLLKEAGLVGVEVPEPSRADLDSFSAVANQLMGVYAELVSTSRNVV
ncbi:MAG: hypothetical protein RBU21_04260, partial [FCB group bacterium]|nr:hypothetical protein [FCB group bacterium]